MRHDVRLWQVAVLSGVLIVGIFGLGFPLSWAVVVSTLAGSLLTEHGLSRLVRTRSARPLSALISGLSVLLLFRSSLVWTYPLVASIAVASKYAVRYQGQHVFNPTNCAVLLGTVFVPGWISSGQWGHAGWLPLALGGFGILVLCRAGRLDSAVAFLSTALVLDWLRISYYGYPLAVLSHHFQNGALWLFALYMLPDPKTTPARRQDARRARWSCGATGLCAGRVVVLDGYVSVGAVVPGTACSNLESAGRQTSGRRVCLCKGGDVHATRSDCRRAAVWSAAQPEPGPRFLRVLCVWSGCQAVQFSLAGRDCPR